MDKSKAIIGTIGRIIIGLVFILSAVLKYLTIESFDLFFFSHKIFPWEVTLFATRLLISLEAIIGLMLVIGIYPKLSRFLTFAMLIGFTIYLLIKPLLFDVSTENCFCFGELVPLTDTQTIIKNVILILLSITLFWAKWWKPKYAKYIFIGIVIGIVATAFIVKPPDFIQAKVHNHSVSIRSEVFESVKELDNVKALNLNKGKKIVCWYSTSCKYCKRTAKKLDIIIERHNLDRNSFIQIFGGKEKPLTEFYKQTDSKPLQHTFIHVIPFLNTTHGNMPVIFLLDNGKIVKLYKMTTIDEGFIVSFLNQ